MKYIKILLLLLSTGMLFARPWENLLNSESPSVEVKPLPYFELSNKIRVYYIKNTILPKSTFELVIDGGFAEETMANAGINTVWGKTLVFSGSAKYPQKKLAEALELNGSEFEFDSTLERVSFSLDSLSDHFENDLAMVIDVLKNPAFSKPDIELMKSLSLQGVRKRKEKPAQMAYTAAQLIQWKNNIRGIISTVKSIDSIDDRTLRAWHEKMMDASRFTILLTGDFEPEKMKSVLDKYFTSFKSSGSGEKFQNLQVTPEQMKKGDQVIYLQVKDIPQTTILYRAHGIKHNDQDYYALKLFDFILGGDSFNSYLTNAIRVKNGWAYSVYSNYSSNAHSGNLNIFTQTQNKNVLQVLNEIHKVLLEPDSIITEERLSAAKNSIKNSLVFMAETPEALGRLQLSLKWDNLPDTYLEQFLENVQKVRIDDLKRVARKYYAPENFFISIVGPENVLTPLENQPKVQTFKTVVPFELPE